MREFLIQSLPSRPGADSLALLAREWTNVVVIDPGCRRRREAKGAGFSTSKAPARRPKP